MRPSSTAQLAALAAALLLASGCDDDDASPTGPTPVAGNTTLVPGATQVRGTERLAWSQSGDTSGLRFRAYIDGRPVALAAATCNNARPEAECNSPLPALSDGVHTIELATLSGSGIESSRSVPVTLQKVAARASVSSLPLASARSGVRLESVITIADGLAFTADVVAAGIQAPAQLSWLPDGRLLVAEADGRVRMVRPGEPENRDPALEPGMLGSPIGPLGIASHPDFAQNRLVYVSLLERERLGAMRLRLVRLREVGDTLGEPATLFEAPVAADAAQTGEVAILAQAGPRMAFGPDRLLYLMLPPGVEFVNEPAASTPRASMLRVAEDGRAPSLEPLSGITATPLSFAWHQTTGALWLLFRGENGEAAMRSLDGRARVMSAEPARLRVREGTGAAAGTLLIRRTPEDLLLLQAFVGTRADGSKGMARVALPVHADGETSDRIGDVVAGDEGTLFAVTNNGLLAGGAPASDVVVRLRPVPALSKR